MVVPVFIKEIRQLSRNVAIYMVFFVFLLVLYFSSAVSKNIVTMNGNDVSEEIVHFNQVKKIMSNKYFYPLLFVNRYGPETALDIGYLELVNGIAKSESIKLLPEPYFVLQGPGNRITGKIISPLYVLFFVFPLVVFFISHDTFSKERELRQFEMVIAQPVKFSKLFFGKFFALLLFVSVLFFVTWSSLFILLGISIVDFVGGFRLPILYSAFITTLLSLVVCVFISYFSKNSSTSMLRLVLIWVCFLLIIPGILTGFFDRELKDEVIKKSNDYVLCMMQKNIPIGISVKHENNILDFYREYLRLSMFSPPFAAYLESKKLLGTDLSSFLMYVRFVREESFGHKINGPRIITTSWDNFIDINYEEFNYIILTCILLCFLLVFIPIIHFEFTEVKT